MTAPFSIPDRSRLKYRYSSAILQELTALIFLTGLADIACARACKGIGHPMHKVGPQYIQIGSLPPDLQEIAVEYLDKTYGKLPEKPDRKGLLWCGHPESSMQKDSSGVEYCIACSDG